MRLVDELGNDIITANGFKADLSRLQAVNILSQIDANISSNNAFDLDETLTTRLLQSAMILADCENARYRETAQRISTAALRLLGQDDESIKQIFALIQARLRNFPAILSDNAIALTPSYAPLTLQFEFIEARKGHSVTVSDGRERILTDFQIDSWRTLLERKSATLSGPTSAGKSYVLLLYIVEQLRNRILSSIVYVVPTRALINQVADDVARELKEAGVNDVTVTTIPVDMGFDKGDRALYVLTQERLEALLIAFPDFRVELVVIDEAQMLSESTRGVLLESVVDRVRDRSPAAQFVFSGPLIGNPRYFGDVFGLAKYSSCETRQSPVTQNLIFLDCKTRPKSEVVVRLGTEAESETVTTIGLPIRLLSDTDKLSYLSYLFGRSGSSVIYAGGKAEAEKIAVKVAQEVPASAKTLPELTELIQFVKNHVHKEYALVGTLAKGVGFHYGHMPSLLRKTLEEYFKARKLTFMVCTSTLLYGLNLPAKNIFLLKPTTGKNSPIDGPDFWNLAGRAGRLGKETEGNVFLIDYSNWGNKPVDEPKDVVVSSALKTALVDQADRLTDFLDDPNVSSEVSPELEITLGKLVLDKRMDRLDRTIERYRLPSNARSLNAITGKIEQISNDIDLPTEVLNRNIGVSIFRQKDLLTYMSKRLTELGPEELIPADPLTDFEVARNSYVRAFKRIHTYLLRYPGKDRRHHFFSGLALRWMRGDPLPVLIDSAIRYYREKGESRSIARIIRDTMENVEDDLRFRYVKFFTCYNSVLGVALSRSGFSEYVETIPNIPLFLEMGGSSGAMISLMALGLSRTTAEVLADYVTDKELDVPGARAWLRAQNFEQLDISAICLKEVSSLLSNNQ
jgi:hypothetical protein